MKGRRCEGLAPGLRDRVQSKVIPTEMAVAQDVPRTRAALTEPLLWPRAPVPPVALRQGSAQTLPLCAPCQ